MPAERLRVLGKCAPAIEPSSQNDKWVKPEVAQAELGICYEQVLKFVKNHELLAMNVAAKPNAKRATYRISRASLDAFIERRSLQKIPTKPCRRRRAATSSTIEFF